MSERKGEGEPERIQRRKRESSGSKRQRRLKRNTATTLWLRPLYSYFGDEREKAKEKERTGCDRALEPASLS